MLTALFLQTNVVGFVFACRIFLCSRKRSADAYIITFHSFIRSLSYTAYGACSMNVVCASENQDTPTKKHRYQKTTKLASFVFILVLN